MTEALNGVVVVDKPVGPSSFGIVELARRLTGARKVGHGGTLDPAASGVLPICFGEATKIAQFLLDADKEYEAIIRFGIVTDTYDATGAVTERHPAGHLTLAQVEEAAAGFRGWIEQRPPIYSALKREGRPLYARARAGEVVEVGPRKVRIDAFQIRAFDVRAFDVRAFDVRAFDVRAFDLSDANGPHGGETAAATPAVKAPGEHPAVQIRVACSKGTYIRSLAYDLGAVLGTGAHLEALRRTRSGPFTLEQAIAPESLGGAVSRLIPPAEALQALPSLTLSPELVLAVSQGKPVPWRTLGTPAPGEGPVRLLDGEGALVAVARRAAADEAVRTLRVFGRDSGRGSGRGPGGDSGRFSQGDV